MNDFSLLIGGQAGDGIRESGNLIARIFRHVGCAIFAYDDYPSLIRGGHNFSIVRAADRQIRCHSEKIDLLIALDQLTLDKHRKKVKEGGFILYDSDVIEEYAGKGLGLPFTSIIKEKKARPIMRNTIAVGALAFMLSLDKEKAKKIFTARIPKAIELNMALLDQGYVMAKERLTNPVFDLKSIAGDSRHPVFNGNEAIALGAVKAGIKLYIAYPMTPSSGLLHFLAAREEALTIKTIHPENEIGVAMMGLGAVYAGVRSMVGTSGGGFALMTEAFSLAGQAELPLVFVLGQRPGPSTGVPTYTLQGDLFQALGAGQGEFLRIIIAPGDVEEAFYSTGWAMNLAWKYQTPVILLTDKHICESTQSVIWDEDRIKVEPGKEWNGEGDYKRYAFDDSGISPMAFPGNPKATVKASSYEHDEWGVTTEEPDDITAMYNKRLQKERTLIKELQGMEVVNAYGSGDIVCVAWGSPAGAVREVVERNGFKLVQPKILNPLPHWGLKKHLEGAHKVIAVENNATALLARLMAQYNIHVDQTILKYDGRPFTVEELDAKIKEAL